MRKMVYTIETKDGLEKFSTISYRVAEDAKKEGYHYKTKLVTVSTPFTKEEKKVNALRFAHMAGRA